ncbi:arsenite efflux ATP-binding protein ArsA [Austwickia chelonae]|uniref:ArsA HSP20-like domain-containing protein n=1 Tax=Austwickia chelonae NBRC 105200 TaxID=1184607 RepID=K6V5Y2_9MICO|nr:hypothetical protein [Austwickia chelonae]GAB77628.1 hypothetical protein AUCHE_05_05430 [Austwickia chelonae NBRC 105200]SEW14459.1 arsenite efflux ATP-binding protein ArsA [Austwickia chelonae]
MPDLHLLTGVGGAGVSTVSAALAAAWAAEGHKVRLAHIADPVSLDRPFPTGDAGRGMLDVVDLAVTPKWGDTDQALADLLVSQGCPGEIAEEWRGLPGADSWQVLAALSGCLQDVDILVVDLGDLYRAGSLIRACTRVPWVMRHLLEAVTGPWGAVAGVTESLLSGLAHIEAGADRLTDAGSVLHLVTSGRPLDEAKIRRSVPGLLLAGMSAGLLVQISEGQEEESANYWRPFAPVRVGPTRLAANGAFAERPEEWAAPLLSGVLPASVGSRPRARIVQDPQCATRLQWSMPLPWTQAADIRLEQRGSDLTLVVHGVAHLLALPSAVRRCEPEAARVVDGEIVIDLLWREGEWRERDL